VPFITSTLEELREKQRRREQNQSKSREDNSQTYRDYPSRELMLALREYAPGAEIVVDGKVYKSEGVTLNWHVPASEQQANETQALRWAWNCRNCGATGDSSRKLEACPSPLCGKSNDKFYCKQYLQPAGFAVRIGYKPDNDLSKNTYVPVQTPWLTVASEWLSFPVPSVGRYRYSAEGHIFHWNAGLHNHGFAVCLRCGKADSETEECPTSEGAPYPNVPASLHEHFRLRGGREASGESRCSGNDDTWAIKRYLWLGTAAHTDVFELQLLDVGDHHQPLNDKTAAYSLAVALRQALAEKLGVDEREIGCDAMHTATDNDNPVWSVVLYDTASGGAGYVASAASELDPLFKRAKEILDQNCCDKACHQCLLSFDTQHQIDNLDRREALKLLTPRFFNGLQLPADKRIFGDASRAELEPVRTAINRELQRSDIGEIRLYLGGEDDAWALPEWSLRGDILRWLSEGDYTVTLVLENIPQDGDLSNALASFIEFGCRVVQDTGIVATARLLAATGNSHHHTQWAVFDNEFRAPGEQWGRSKDGQHCVRHTKQQALPKLAGKALSASALRRDLGGGVHELKITTELDGQISGFGTRFWQAVMGAGMASKLTGNGMLKEIHYTDRYLKSPLTIKLFSQLVSALATKYSLVAPDTRLIVRSAEIEPKRITPEKIEHDWQQDQQRNKVAELLLQQYFPGQIDVDSRHRKQLPHARELRLVWQNGKEWILRFDQGMGYWIPNKKALFGFDQAVGKQAEQLADLELVVEARDARYPTILYCLCD
jgi:hypothetical protein